MKQTNNAIKFLMAQYRAIFKSAYVKGLATAVVLTSALAAGQANAEAVDFDASMHTFTGTVTIKEDGSAIVIGNQELKPNGSSDFALNKDSGGEWGIYLGGTKNQQFNFSGASINVKSNDPAGFGSRVGFNVGTYEFASGTTTKIGQQLTLDSKDQTSGDVVFSGGGSLEVAGYLTITNNDTSNSTGKYDLSGADVLVKNGPIKGDKDEGGLIIGDEITVGNFTLAGTAELGLFGESGTKINIKLNDDKVFAFTGEHTLTGYKASGDQTVDNRDISLTFNAVNNAGLVQVAPKAQLTIKNGVEIGSKVTFDVQDGSTLINNANLSVAKGGTLKINQDQISLNSDEYKSGHGVFAPSGSLTLAGGTLDITGSEQFDLSSNLKFTGTDKEAGSIHVSGSGKVAGDNLVISKALDSSATTLTVQANSLTLGNGSTDGISAFSDANIKKITVYDKLVLNPGNGEYFSFSDKNQHNLSNLDGGLSTIEGNMSFEGTGENVTQFIVKGDWALNGDLRFKNGGASGGFGHSLQIGGTQVSSSLTINGEILNSHVTNSWSDILVENTKSTATLDLTNATFASEGSGGVVGFVASTNGTVKLTGEQLTDILKESNDDTKGFYIGFDKAKSHSGDYGVLDVDGGFSANFDDIVGDTVEGTAGNVLTNNITVKSGSTGTIKADSAVFTATDATNASAANATELDMAGLTLDVNSLTVTNNVYTDNKIADTATVKNGIFNIGSALTSSNKKLVADNGAFLYLGADATAQGSINVGTLSLENGAKAYFTGKWNAASTVLDVKSGTATVNADSDLTVKGLNTASSGTVAVDNGSLTVSGFTVEGQSGTGINLAANSVTIHNGNLTLGNTIANGITFTDNTLNAQGIANNAITLNGGIVTVDFSSGTSFSSEQLVTLKEHLFANDTNGTIDGTLNIGGAAIGNLNLGTADANGRYDFDNVASVADVTEGGVTNNQLTGNAFTTADGTNVAGTVGAIHVTNGSSANISHSAGFVNSAVNGGYFVSAVGTDGKDTAADINFTGSNLTLQNGGAAGTVSLNGTTGSTLVVDSQAGTTKLTGISGNTGSTVEIVSGNTEVAKNVTAGELNLNGNLSVGGNTSVTDLNAVVAENTQAPVLSTGKLTVNGDTNFSGNITATGKAAFGNNATIATYLGGNNSFADVDFNNATELDRGTTTAQNVKLAADLNIIGNASLTADVITGAKGFDIRVGEEKLESDPDSQDAAGYLVANRLDLNGADLIADPAYGSAASIVAVGSVGANTDLEKYDAGVLDGNAIALRNSILAIGVKNSEQDNVIGEIKDTFAKYLNDNGSLDRDNIGAVAYVAKNINLATGSQIIVDSERSFSQYDTDKNIYTNKDIYLGKNSALAISDDAVFNQHNGVAIEIADTGASIYADVGSKIILTGDSFSVRDDITLFRDGDGDGIMVEGNDLYVETMNGLMFFKYDKDQITGTQNLQLNHAKIDAAFNQASAPVKYSLISYAANDNNWAAQGGETYKADPLHGELAKGVEAKDANTFIDANGNTLNARDYIAVQEGEKLVAYKAADNYFLDAVVRDSTTGIEAETAARLGVFGGSVQAAMTAGTATSDAIAGRFGMGAQTAGMTYADNGQGTGLWVTPIYRNADSDGFAAQGADYGTDLNLYGVALGGDYTLANGLRVGAMFNIGSGDADGQGAGSLATNDFDYYGFAAFAGYTMGQFTVVGDISYTVVDNEVTANTAVDKIGANFDTSNLSVGVTGQYALNLNSLEVTPHAGLRFSSIDMDDYTVDGKDVVAAYNGDTMNVFSIPVGVTIAREFEGETWTVKPSFDLTLTGQFGDDEAEGTVEWAGIDNLHTNVASEVFDNFTYGAAVGVAARTGNFSLGFGLNYTGSSNVDEFGVNANARYVF